MPNPSLIFVPGAWHGPETWDKVTSILGPQSFHCIAITLPTTSSSPDATFAQDVASVRDAIITETSLGRDVVVIVHSYGGAVGASAIKGFTQPPTTPSTGRVIGFFMMATGFIPPGTTFLENVGGKPPPFWEVGADGLANLLVDTRELFYHDLPEEEGKEWVGRLRGQSMKAFTTGGELAYNGWADVPVWFLATQLDRPLPVEAQRMFVKDAQAQGADVTLREIETSHSPMLSRPEETAGVIVEAVAAFKK